MATRYEVSPYLQDVAFDPADYDLVTPCRMLFDHLHRRHVLIAGATYDALAALAARRAMFHPPDIAELRPELEFLITSEIVVAENEAYRRHNYASVEIEINRHCNYRCEFCPVSLSPRPRAVMGFELFSLLVDRVVEYGATTISLNHYSEPTLHPELVRFCQLAADRGLQVRLHSNASLLDEHKIEGLRRAGNLFVIVNLPSDDPEVFRAKTRTGDLARVRRNIELLRAANIPVELSVNTEQAGSEAVLARINETFAPLLGRQRRWPTDDRAGRMVDLGRYAAPTHHAGALSGCALAAWQINVDHRGRVFLCCQDFEQQYIVGDLTTSSLREIAEGEPMVALRRKIFGADDVDESLLCARCHKTCARGRASTPFAVGQGARRRFHGEEIATSELLMAQPDIGAHLPAGGAV